jgi:hypothetical protein
VRIVWVYGDFSAILYRVCSFHNAGIGVVLALPLVTPPVLQNALKKDILYNPLQHTVHLIGI